LAAVVGWIGGFPMVDLLLGFAFVAMILSPAIVATVQRSRSHSNGNKPHAS
jgi:hypothetical protein